MNTTIDVPPAAVLDFFAPQSRHLVWSPAPRGLSGAVVWCGTEKNTPRLAIKAWPARVTDQRVREIHTQMRRVEALSFVPRVLAGTGGTVCLLAGRVWDCCEWKQGEPRYAPTLAQVEAAWAALARLHQLWRGEPHWGVCPAVVNRLRVLAECEPLWQIGPHQWPTLPPRLQPFLRDAYFTCRSLVPRVDAQLRELAGRSVPLQLCLRDVRVEHILFNGDEVCGIIDYGAVAVDHPAVDVARLWGDYAVGNDEQMAAAMAAYQRVAGTVPFSEAMVRQLAATGVICSLVGWLVRLVMKREFFADIETLVQRLVQLLGRAATLATWL